MNWFVNKYSISHKVRGVTHFLSSVNIPLYFRGQVMLLTAGMVDKVINLEPSLPVGFRGQEISNARF